MLRLALAYLRERSLLSALNVLLLSLAVAMLVILLNFSAQMSDRFERDAQGIDLVVGAKGSPLQLILSSVYHVDMPTGNIPLSSIDLLRGDPAVARVIPVALGDNFRGFRIVGTEESYAQLYDAELAEGRMFTANSEAVLGSKVAEETGVTLGQQFVGSHGLVGDDGGAHEHHPMETVGILAPTGTVMDRLILVSVETVWDVHGIEHDHAHGDHDHGEDGHSHDHEAHDHGEAAHSHDHEAHDHGAHDHEAHDHGAHDHGAHAHGAHAHDDAPAAIAEPAEEQPMRAGGFQRPDALAPEVTALLVTYRSAAGAVRLPSMINRQTDMQAAVPAVETTRLLSMLGVGIDGARLFGWLLALIGGLSIFVALLNAASAREGELALLRMMGANKLQVFGTIIAEGVIIATAGAILGLLLGHGLLAVAASMFRPVQEMGLDPLHFEPAEITIVLLVIAIGVVAALIPAWRVFRADLTRILARAT
ncbi:FtsX-like permease family protein [Parasphingopyxis sp.]|uniref:ABC transporter permease n=1 Tax=Parasphingopyxis sp. TaxID=1920299 RepID=UPI00262EF752|nr:FtsX-like permease family protein [Parasphingopyxis sp.]